MPDFLPGNWSVHDRTACQENWAVGSDHDFPGAPGTTHRRYVAQIMTLEDAHLVSAAKELYAALEALLNHSHLADLANEDLDPDDINAESNARAALRKARGEKSS